MLCTNNIARCTGCTASQNHNGSKLVHIILVTQVCFTSLLRQKLQLAGFLLHLYSGSETPDFMPSVAPLQWARGERLQVPGLSFHPLQGPVRGLVVSVDRRRVMFRVYSNAVRFACTTGQRLQVPHIPYELYSEPGAPGSVSPPQSAPGCRQSVSPIQ